MEELQRQIDSLKIELETLKNARDLDHNVLMYNALFNGRDIAIVGDISSYGSNLQRTIDIDATPIFVVPENPINSAIININGTNYRILLYSLT